MVLIMHILTPKTIQYRLKEIKFGVGEQPKHVLFHYRNVIPFMANYDVSPLADKENMLPSKSIGRNMFKIKHQPSVHYLKSILGRSITFPGVKNVHLHNCNKMEVE
eukprot:TRINITY_DN8753_c0_g2_i1.p1 TRINITY_DN8753_c0_g2~~TRINITY_DN8753_c0_g2_i1.p1  ORF type:complete len:106 (-),score=5.87 TRINITY_DN8753_c0_g2_i1:196-513(-)